MGFWNWLSGEPTPVQPLAPSFRPVKFAVGEDYQTWNALVGLYAGTSVTRDEAMSVPAVKRARDVFCSLASILPVQARNADELKVDRALLVQPEKFNGLTRSVSMSWLMDDLFFYSESLWKVADRDYTGYPTVVDRIPHGRWHVDEATSRVMVEGVKMNSLDCIIFKSPNDPMVTAGGATIKALLALEATAGMYINQPQAMEYFRSTQGVELTDEQVQDFLSDVNAARKANASGWLPDGVERIPVERMSANDLQLREAREFSILEISRLTGLSPNWLGVPVTTRTYTNMQDERRDLIDFQASPYLRAIEERLSLGDVTPNGQRVLFNMDAFLRANTLERMQAYQIGLAVGAYTQEEIRSLENRPPLGDTNG